MYSMEDPVFLMGNTLYVNYRCGGIVYLIIGSDGKNYILTSETRKFKAITQEKLEGYPLVDFEMANPIDHHAIYQKVLRSVPTSRNFWIYALTPQVTTFKLVSYEGHKGFTFPEHLNIYLTHDGEYLGCESKMEYNEELAAFIPTNAPKVVMSLGFKGGHGKPQVVHEQLKNPTPYSNVNKQLINIMQLGVDESCNFNGNLTRDSVQVIQKSLGIKIYYEAGAKNFNKTVYRTA